LRGTVKAAAALERLAHKPAGMDRAQQVTHLALGHYRVIVILLQFPPDPLIPSDPGVLADTLAHPPSAYDSLFFSVGTRPQGSVRDYYRETSGNLFDIDGVVTRWYTAPHPYSYYTAGQSGAGEFPRNAQQMASDAVALADQDLDFRQFDSDGPDQVPNSGDDDGYVDGIFVVHAGPGAEETASGDDIYSHEFELDAVYHSNDIGFFGAIKDSVYTTEPEKWAGLAPHTSPNLIMSIGTYCHEFGHVLGLPDLYDTRSDPASSEGVGEWDLMGSGNFNHAPGETLGTSPAHFSAWSKQTLGWITPTVLSADQTGVALAPVEVHRIVLDTGAAPDLAQHFEVIVRTHAESLRFEQFALRLELGQSNLELLLDPRDRFPQTLLVGDVVRRREQREAFELFDDLTRQRIDAADSLDLVASFTHARGILDHQRVGADMDGVFDHVASGARNRRDDGALQANTYKAGTRAAGAS
jgi:M6 family metalloprotease-like protein